MLASWPNDQWVGATGASAPGRCRVRRSGLVRFASTWMRALSMTRVRLRSERARTMRARSSSDRKRSSQGRENHSEDTRLLLVPRVTSTLKPPLTSRRASRTGMFMGNLHDGRRKPLSRHQTRHGNSISTLTLWGRCGALPAEGGGRDGRLGRGGRLSPSGIHQLPFVPVFIVDRRFMVFICSWGREASSAKVKTCH